MSGWSFWRALVTDPRSTRAIEETLLDIRAERASAAGAARIVWALHAVAALARVAVHVSLVEFSAIAPGAWAIRLLLWTAGATAVLAGPVLLRLRLPDGVPGWLAVMLLPQALSVVLPFSVLWTTLWPPRTFRAPIVLSSLVAVAIVVASLAATPCANRLFQTVLFTASGGQGTLSRGIPEMSIPELAQVGFLHGVSSVVTASRARQQFFLLTGLIALAGSWAATGQWLARVGRRRWRWAIALPAMVVVAASLTDPASAFWAVAIASLPVARWWSSRGGPHAVPPPLPGPPQEAGPSRVNAHVAR